MTIETETAEEIKQRLDAEKQQGESVKEVQNEEIQDENTSSEEKKTLRLPLSQRLELAYSKLGETEKEAWSQGWRPQEVFAGKSKDGSNRQWVDAETFLSNSKDKLPVANERIRDLTSRIEKAEKEAREAKERVAKAEKRGYEQAMRELEKKQREAVELGDTEAFDNLKKQEGDLIKSQYTLPESKVEEKPSVVDDMVQDPYSPPPQPKQENRQFSEAERASIADFYARNTWMKTDQDIADYAVFKEAQLMQQRPYLSVKERLDIVQEEVVATFHQRLNGTKGSSMFDTPSNQGFGDTQKKPSGFMDLPNDIRGRCEDLIKIRKIDQKGYKGMKGQDALKAFRNDYAKSHFTFN